MVFEPWEVPERGVVSASEATVAVVPVSAIRQRAAVGIPAVAGVVPMTGLVPVMGVLPASRIGPVGSVSVASSPVGSAPISNGCVGTGNRERALDEQYERTGVTAIVAVRHGIGPAGAFRAPVGDNWCVPVFEPW
jgi:hypothetical protein